MNTIIIAAALVCANVAVPPACPPGERLYVDPLNNCDCASSPSGADFSSPSSASDPGTKTKKGGNHYGNTRPDENPTDSRNRHDGQDNPKDREPKGRKK
jgi:hypothetical protein